MTPAAAPPDTSSIGAASPDRTPRWLKLLVLLFSLVILTGGGLFIAVASSALQASRDIQSPLDVVLHFGDPLAQDANGRTNILILGSGGKEWDDGTDLTDSIMVASIDEAAGRVTLISIPRDLYVRIPGYGWSRVNYTWPYSVRHASGGLAVPDLPKIVFGAVTGLDIHYAVKVDFRGFTRVIDALGGVDVIVERSFIDRMYPTENYGYRVITFEEGPTTMDGARALEFTRSRHSVGPEGSDIARARRQQLVVQAVRERLLASDILDDRAKITELVNLVNEHYVTDLTLGQDLTLAKVTKKIPRDGGVVSIVLSHEGRTPLLMEPTAEQRATLYGGAAVLIPVGGTYDAIHRFIRRVQEDPTIVLAPPKVVVLNGTGTVGLAGRMGAVIGTERFDVIRTGNAASREHVGTVVVDLNGTKAKEAARVAGLVGGRVGELPEGEERPEGVDILVIVGATPPAPAPAP